MALLLGTAPNQVPTNGDLGTSAFIDANALSIGGNAATVTTNANLTGAVTSVGNATTLSNAVVTSAKLSTDLQASTFGFKNRIINGDMRIDQRNAGASVTPSSGLSQYLLDRWMLEYSQTSKLTIQQNAGAVTPPAGYKNYLGITVAAAVTIGVSDYFDLQQKIEGLNVADFSWGTASASPVTLSFWVRSSLTGTFGGSLRNGGGSRSYPFTYSINLANTWEQKTVSIVGDQSGTWPTDNGIGWSLILGLGVGSTYSGASGSWAGANYASATGAVSVVGTSGATFYITGVQLEKGSTATSFDFRDYGRELIMCQRYFCLVDFGCGNTTASTSANIAIAFPVGMRAPPSATMISARVTDAFFSDYASSAPAISVQNSTTFGARVALIGFTGMTANRPSMLIGSGPSAAPINFSAEL